MKASRDRLKRLMEEGHVHPALCLNFDQLWRSCYQFGGTLLYKDRSKVGKRTHKSKAPKKVDKTIAHSKGSTKGHHSASYALQ